MNRFNECINVIIEFEGYFSDHPLDKGGKTKYGITEATLNSAYQAGLLNHNNIYALSIDEVKVIYKANYWDKCNCDSLPQHLDLCVFDTAVNCGVGTSAKLLQKTINDIVGANILKVDGIIGSMTLGAIEGWLSRYKDICIFPLIFLCDRFLDKRLEYYSNIVANNSSQLVFLRGWLNTVLNLKEVIVSG